MTTEEMPPLDGVPARQQLSADIRQHTRRELSRVGLRLARSLAARFGMEAISTAGGLAEPARDALAPALAFAEQFAASQPPERGPPPPAHPLLRLAAMPRSPVTARLLQDLVLLACLPEAHEGYARSEERRVGK